MALVHIHSHTNTPVSHATLGALRSIVKGRIVDQTEKFSADALALLLS
jgi:hypothetical protein